MEPDQGSDQHPDRIAAQNPMMDAAFVAGLRTIPSGIGDDPPAWPATDFAGVRPDGTSVSVELASLGRPLLLVFLSVQCDGCDAFWSGLSHAGNADLAHVVPVVVTKGPPTVDSTEVAALADQLDGIDVVMTDTAWADYRVTGYPFLVIVDPGSRRILAEAVGFGWSDVASTIRAGLQR